MRSKIAQRILNRTSPETKSFVKKYAELVTRIQLVLNERNWSQKDLAVALEKQPSEISKWLKEQELGTDLFYVPKTVSFEVHSENKVSMTVYKNEPLSKDTSFVPAQKYLYTEKTA